ncbi:ImmA/IrrE family metallo-endopeptidase [Rheinheimera soli]|uniref:ImmA/IrrE family metallo-endopeptidase n=1 Tax=Rheinheimera soli TaxID=443616 RepID=UPI001E5EE704
MDRSTATAVRKASELIIEMDLKNALHKNNRTRINPFYIAATRGVEVLLRPLDKLLGAFLNDSVPGILINSERPAGLITMTCAHELGHFFLGHEAAFDFEIDYSPSALEIERLADTFAYSLLTPSWLIPYISNIKGWGVSDLNNAEHIYQLSLRLGISYTATVLALVRQKIITQYSVKESLLKTSPASIKQRIISGYSTDGFSVKGDIWLVDDQDKHFVIEPKIDDVILAKLKNKSSSGFIWSLECSVDAGFQIEPLLIPFDESRKNHFNEDSAVGEGEDVLMRIKTNQHPNVGELFEFSVYEDRIFQRSGSVTNKKIYKTEFHSFYPGLEKSSKDRKCERISQKND